MERGALIALGATLSMLAVAASGSGEDDPADAAVRRALPHLAEATDAWIEEHTCITCHQVTMSVWAMNESRAQGFAVDERLAGWNRYALDAASVGGDAEDPEKARRMLTDELWQLLLSGSVDDAEAGADPERARLRSLLDDARLEDGSWGAQGQLTYQDRPAEETAQATSLWSAYALRVAGSDGDRAQVEALAESTTTEHLALRWIAARDAADGAADGLLAQLLSEQNEDGGWGWELAGDSDALATGMALYLLPGTPGDEVPGAIERARDFLLTTQGEDGIWQVPSTLVHSKGEINEVTNDWGTAWAVIGLLRSRETPSAPKASGGG